MIGSSQSFDRFTPGGVLFHDMRFFIIFHNDATSSMVRCGSPRISINCFRELKSFIGGV